MFRQNSFSFFFLILIGLPVAAFWQIQTSSNSLLRRVTNTSPEVISLNPSLSGDGSQVAFESTGDLAGLGGAQRFRAIKASMSVEPSRFAEVGNTRAVSPSQSQDGSRITFASHENLIGQNEDRNSEIFMHDGSTLTQITNTTSNSLSSRLGDGNFQPSISDDGTLIAFSSNRNLAGSNADLNFQIFLYDTATRTFNQITVSQGTIGATDAKIAGDRSSVAFIQDSSSYVVGGAADGAATADLTSRDLMLYNRATESTATIVSKARALSLTYGRAISDDGLRVVYSAETGENQSQVFLYDRRFDSSRQITSLGVRDDDVSPQATISGDGKRITFSTRRNVIGGNGDRSVELYLFDIPTGQFSQLTDAPSSATAEVVSSLNDVGTLVVFNFPRVLFGLVSDNNLANNSEICVLTLGSRPASGTLVIVNGASLGTETSAVKALAPTSIANAQGIALASKTDHAEPLVEGSFPTSVAGTVVTVNGRMAQLLYVSPTQVSFVLPSETEIGEASVVVTNADGFQSQSKITIAEAAPGIFTVTGTGRGEAVILNASSLAPAPFDSSDGKLRLIIFATGVRGSANPLIKIADHELAVELVLESANLPGLDEIYVSIPVDFRESGTLDLFITANGRDSNRVEITFAEPTSREIVINEVLADPPDGLAGDANHDGIRDSSQDEFVELVNFTERDLDLSGYQLQTRGSSGTNVLRHKFAPNTIFSAGTALVVFGGGVIDQKNKAFAGAQIIHASTGGLSLLNAGALVTLRDPSGSTITSMSYGGSTGRRGDLNESLVRSPEITGSFVLHKSVPEAGGLLFSPGSRLDGSAFLSYPAISRIVIAPAFKTLVVNGQVQFVGKAFDQTEKELTDVLFTWQSNNTDIVTIDPSGLAKAIATGNAEVTAAARGVISVPSLITVTTPSPTPTATPTPPASPSPSPTPFATPLPDPSASPTPAPRIVISEFRTRGPNGAGDEFIELYNDSDSPAPIGGWKIKASSSGGTVTTRLIINSATMIPPRGHFLASNSAGYSGSVTSDQQFSAGIANDGGIALTLPNDATVDQIGLSAGSAFKEGMHTAPLPSDANQSYERKPGGVIGSTQDSGDNFNDLKLITPSDPQNLGSTPTPGPSPSPSPSVIPSISPAPSPSITPTPSPSPTAQPSPDPSPSPPPSSVIKIVISQVYGGGGNSGSPYRNDFIEVFNSGETSVNLAGWSVQYASPTSSTWSTTSLTALTLLPGQYHLIQETSGGSNGDLLPTPDSTGTIAMSATAGKVALVRSSTPLTGTCPVNSEVVDLVGYGNTANCFRGFGPAPTLTNTASALRKADGCTDSQNNSSDFISAVPNPRNSQSAPRVCAIETVFGSFSKDYRRHWRELLVLLL